MKMKRIYAEVDGMCQKDISKDRVILDLSENEWLKLKVFVDLARFSIPKNTYTGKRAQNIYLMFKNRQELISEFKELPF